MDEVDYYLKNIIQPGIILHEAIDVVDYTKINQFSKVPFDKQANIDQSQQVCQTSHTSCQINTIIDEKQEMLCKLQMQSCNEYFNPHIDSLINPFSVKYPNNQIMNSATQSVIELLLDERIGQDNIFSNRIINSDNNDFYEQVINDCLYSQCQRIPNKKQENEIHPIYPLQPVKQNSVKSVDIIDCDMEKFCTNVQNIFIQLQEHLFNQICNEKIKFIFEKLQKDLSTQKENEEHLRIVQKSQIYQFIIDAGPNQENLLNAKVHKNISQLILFDGVFYYKQMIRYDAQMLDLLLFTYQDLQQYEIKNTRLQNFQNMFTQSEKEHQLMFGDELENNNCPSYNKQYLYEQQQYLDINTNSQLIQQKALVIQQILLCLLCYFYDNNFIQQILQNQNFLQNGNQIGLDLIQQEYNIMCSKYFQQIDLSQFMDEYKIILDEKYYSQLQKDFSKNNIIHQPILDNQYKYLFSDVGNKYQFTSKSNSYEPANQSQQQNKLQIKQVQQPIISKTNDTEYLEESKFQQHNPLQSTQAGSDEDYQVTFIQTTSFVSFHEYFHPVFHPLNNYQNQTNQQLLQQNIRLEQLRNKCKQFNKQVQICKKNLIRRFRVNKNGNQINSECVRLKKIVQDFDQLRKKILGNSSQQKRLNRQVIKRQLANGHIQISPAYQALHNQINQKLGETELLIKEISLQFNYCQQNGHNEQQNNTAQVQQNDLNIQILDQPQQFKGVLKHYQKIGFSWLVQMFNSELNPLLCDQMGLGKTVQIIAYFLHLAENYQYGPFIVICPNSLLNNWVSELKRFADVLNVWPYWGNVNQRQTIRQGFQHLIQFNNVLEQNQQFQNKLNNSEMFGTRECPLHVLVTSYSLAVQDIKYLNKIPWLSIVLDEGQMIKSSETKRWRVLMKYKTANKILLSGTPVQNSLDELWSLLHFVMPRVFQSKENFAEWFGRDIESAAQSLGQIKLNSEQLERLHNLLRPFVLRREKKDVASQLGEKVEKEVICQLSKKQRILYKQIKNQCSIIQQNDQSNNFDSEILKNIIMQLRKVVNHPQLFNRQYVKFSFCFRSIESILQQKMIQYQPLNNEDTNTKQNDEDSNDDITTILHKLTDQKNIDFQMQLKEKVELQNQLQQNDILSNLTGNNKIDIQQNITKQNYFTFSEREQSTFQYELRQIMEILPTLYENRKEINSRDHYLMINVDNYKNIVFEYQIPKLVVEELLNYEEKYNKLFQQFNCFMSLNDVLQLSNSSLNQYMTFLAAIQCLQQNNYMFNYWFGGSGCLSHQQLYNYCKSFNNQYNQQKAIIQCSQKQLVQLQQILNNHQLFDITANIQLNLNSYDVNLFMNCYQPKVVASLPVIYTSSLLTRNTIIHKNTNICKKCNILLQQSISSQALSYAGVHTLLEESGKLQVLDNLLHSLFVQNQICLIYCQMTKMMDILEDYLKFRNYVFVRLDGGMSVAERRQAVDRFMTDSKVFVFLLSTRAGSLGLNLTRANNVIFYENDWNPTADAQASDRVHRIGQQKNVQIWRIVAQNTVDERILRRAEEKNTMQKMVLQGQERDQYGNLLIKKNQQKELLLELLKD